MRSLAGNQQAEWRQFGGTYSAPGFINININTIHRFRFPSCGESAQVPKKYESQKLLFKLSHKVYKKKRTSIVCMLACYPLD